MVEFIQQLVLSYESERENSDTSDPADHVLDFFTPYEDQNSSSKDEMEFPQLLYDNTPLSDSASRQAIIACVLLLQIIFHMLQLISY